jgi:EpsI family protein
LHSTSNEKDRTLSSVADHDTRVHSAISRQTWIAAAIMLGALALGLFAAPTATWYDRLNRPDYATLIPRTFGEWRSERDSDDVVSPQEAGSLDAVYSQTVSRRYVQTSTGRLVMLSVAYGERQYSGRQTHRPESCYSSQGFTVSDIRPTLLNVARSALPAYRMSANQGWRHERVTYWIRMGNRLMEGSGYHQTLTRLGMNMRGAIPDGLLFRVSEISSDNASSDVFLDRFISDLLSSVSGPDQTALIGHTL